MKYQDFINTKQYKKTTGKTLPDQKWEDAISGTGFPLLFDLPDPLLEEIDSFSVMYDFMASNDMDPEEGNFEEQFKEKFPHYVPFAIVDVETAEKLNPAFEFDSYAEIFLGVDTSKESSPVFIWDGERHFEPLYDSFEAFYKDLINWKPENN